MTQATIDELQIAEDPASWAALGFSVEERRCLLGTVRVRFTGRRPGAGIVGWSVRGLASVELDGLPTSTAVRPPAEPGGPHPNGVTSIDHIVAMTPHLDRTIRALQAAGLSLRRVREEPTPAGAPRQAFFRLGGEILEVVQMPEQAMQAAGGEAQPARFWGIALRTEDMQGTIAAFGPHVGDPHPAVQRGRSIATVARSAGLAVPLALIGAEVRDAA